jgi:ribose 5-phosphate isomerase B
VSIPSRKDIENVARELLRGMDDAGPRRRSSGSLVSDSDVRAAKRRGETVLVVPPGTLVTPLARDAANECGIEIRVGGGADLPVTTNPVSANDGGPAPIDGGVIALGSDHGGLELKNAIKRHLERVGRPTADMGTHTKESCDYPDFAAAVAGAVALGEASWGILVDGAGIGSCMAAGKVPGVLSATCHDVRTAKNSREHNGANVLCLGSGTLDERAALQVVDAWLATPFAGGRHGRRVNKIRAIERSFVR